tara:strand:- start:524 stop:1531 length:1008 start_codon:yes stop_codon:yes gene_type:complete
MDHSFKIKSIILMVLLMTSLLRSQAAGIGGGPNAFYKLPLTAREVSLGGAGIAISRGPFSAFWNPASIVDLDNRVSFGGNIKLLQNENMLTNDLKIVGVSGNPFTSHLIFGSLSLIQRSVEGIEQTSLVYDEIEILGGQSNLTESLLIGTFAVNVRGVNAGVSWRPSRSRLDNITWSSLKNFDIGFLMSEETWDYGFVMKLDSDSLYSDLSFGTGLVLKYKPGLEEPRARFTVDLKGGMNNFSELATGIEYGFEVEKLTVFIRGGMNWGVPGGKVTSGQFEQRYASGGLGLKIPSEGIFSSMSLDCSYTSYFPTDTGHYMSFVDFLLKMSLILQK